MFCKRRFRSRQKMRSVVINCCCMIIFGVTFCMLCPGVFSISVVLTFHYCSVSTYYIIMYPKASKSLIKCTAFSMCTVRLQSRGLESVAAGLQSLRLASRLKPWLRTIDGLGWLMAASHSLRVQTRKLTAAN